MKLTNRRYFHTEKPKLMYAVLIIGITILFFMFYSFNIDEDAIVLGYSSTSSQIERDASVEIISQQVKAAQTQTTPSTSTSQSPSTSPDVDDWCKLVDWCHRHWGIDEVVVYVYGGPRKIRDSKGKLIEIRSDCSGFLNYCTYEYGKTPPKGGASDFDYTTIGMKKFKVNSYSELQVGDIVAWPGQHIAVYAGKNGSNEYWDWGADVKGINKYKGQSDPWTCNNLSSNGRSLSNANVYRW